MRRLLSVPGVRVMRAFLEGKLMLKGVKQISEHGDPNERTRCDCNCIVK